MEIGIFFWHFHIITPKRKREYGIGGKNQMKVIMGIVKAATKLTDPNQAVNILEKISKKE